MIEGAKSRNNNDLRNNDVGVSFDYYESPSDEVTFAAAASNDQGGRPVEEMLMDRFGQKTESIDGKSNVLHFSFRMDLQAKTHLCTGYFWISS